MNRPFFLVATILLALPQMGQAEPAGEAALRTLYEKSGLDFQIEQTPAIFQMSVEQRGARRLPDQRFLALMKDTIDTAFAENKLEQYVFEALNGRLEESDVDKALTWLDSELGRRVTQLENEGSTPESTVEVVRFAASLNPASIDPHRLEIIRQFDEAVGATQTAVDVAMNVHFAGAVAAATRTDGSARLDLAELAGSIEAARPQFHAAVAPFTTAMLLYTYQSLSLEELRTYLAFVHSEVGMRYHDVMRESLTEAFRRASMEWASLFVDGVKRLAKEKGA